MSKIDQVRAFIYANLPADTLFALAFSGGGDSLALLCHLRAYPNLAAVLIVDHGLREGSDDEARAAQALAAKLGVEAEILTWASGGAALIKTGLQAKARRARYGLLGEACRARNIPVLLTAHHGDDQAETVLMRLDRGTGWRGAAGMRVRSYAPVWPELADVTLIRPALGVSRKDLRTCLTKTSQINPIHDPSNDSLDFTRIRARQYLAARPDLRADLCALAADMAEGRAAERDHVAADLAAANLSEQGVMRFPHLPRSATLCVLAPIIGGQSGPVDRARVAKARLSLAESRSVSLGSGCLAVWRKGAFHLGRDPVAMTGRQDGRLAPTAVPISLTARPHLWDGRFMVSGEGGMIHPVRAKNHIGYSVETGQNVQVRSLIKARLQAYLAGM